MGRRRRHPHPREEGAAGALPLSPRSVMAAAPPPEDCWAGERQPRPAPPRAHARAREPALPPKPRRERRRRRRIFTRGRRRGCRPSLTQRPLRRPARSGFPASTGFPARSSVCQSVNQSVSGRCGRAAPRTPVSPERGGQVCLQGSLLPWTPGGRRLLPVFPILALLAFSSPAWVPGETICCPLCPLVSPASAAPLNPAVALKGSSHPSAPARRGGFHPSP